MVTDDIKRPATLATMVLSANARASAQDADEEEEDLGFEGDRQSRFLEEEEEIPSDDFLLNFSFRRYRHELMGLLYIVLAVFLVHRFIRPRHRRGCSIIVVFVFVLYYVFSCVLRLI